MHSLFICGCITFVFYLTVLFLEPEQTSDLFDFIEGMSLGISFGMVVVGIIMTSKYADRIVEWKVKNKRCQKPFRLRGAFAFFRGVTAGHTMFEKQIAYCKTSPSGMPGSFSVEAGISAGSLVIHG